VYVCKCNPIHVLRFDWILNMSADELCGFGVLPKGAISWRGWVGMSKAIWLREVFEVCTYTYIRLICTTCWSGPVLLFVACVVSNLHLNARYFMNHSSKAEKNIHWAHSCLCQRQSVRWHSALQYRMPRHGSITKKRKQCFGVTWISQDHRIIN
jgi:hypothetical protein